MKSPCEPSHNEGGLGSALKVNVQSLLQTTKVNSDWAYYKYCSLYSVLFVCCTSWPTSWSKKSTDDRSDESTSRNKPRQENHTTPHDHYLWIITLRQWNECSTEYTTWPKLCEHSNIHRYITAVSFRFICCHWPRVFQQRICRFVFQFPASTRSVNVWCCAGEHLLFVTSCTCTSANIWPV